MMRTQLLIVAIVAWLLPLQGSFAMDRWAALSMLESGDNDHAVGRSGELSRFQICPVLWPGGDPQNSHDSLAAAQQIMEPRLEEFERSHKRAATDAEFYILWNAPWQINSPTRAVAERARRFANLVQRSTV
jgi:hypothetical protein